MARESSEATFAAVQDGNNPKVIACNIVLARSTCSRGSLAYSTRMASGGDRARVLVRSRSSRWITCWVPISQLGNFRFKLLPNDHPRRSRIGQGGEFFTNDDLVAIAQRGAGQGLQLRRH